MWDQMHNLLRAVRYLPLPHRTANPISQCRHTVKKKKLFPVIWLDCLTGFDGRYDDNEATTSHRHRATNTLLVKRLVCRIAD